MPDFSLLFAGTFQDAIDSAAAWGWIYVDPLHSEFQRPDSGERVRFVHVGALQNLKQRTRVYIGANASRRDDIGTVVDLVMKKFFVLGDPRLPPVRPRRKDRVTHLKEELKTLMEKL